MRERIRLLREARALADDELVECSPRDKWEKPTKWAVMKCTKDCTTEYEIVTLITKGDDGDAFELSRRPVRVRGQKRAVKLHDSEAGAEVHAKELIVKAKNGVSYAIQKRPGACVRCERYCSAAQVCPFVVGGAE